MGADVLHGASVVCSDDPLREPTPLPSANGTAGLARIGGRLLSRHGKGEPGVDASDRARFVVGRAFLRSRVRPRTVDVALAALPDSNRRGPNGPIGSQRVGDSRRRTVLREWRAARRFRVFDSAGARRRLGPAGRHRDGAWLDVPPIDDGLAVNFGKVLERWCGGRIKATEHRVIGTGRERMSIPFFYEARADAEIRPLPVAGAASFEPFLYGDYLWATTTQFVEFKGMESLRKPIAACLEPGLELRGPPSRA